MTYALLASLRVGDTMKLSAQSRPTHELFKVIAIERDVDEFGTPIAALNQQRTIRVLARRINHPESFVQSVFFATEARNVSNLGESPFTVPPTSRQRLKES
jgi:hypothetical protein